MSNELDTAITAAAAVENQEKEALLRFGPNVHVTFNPAFPTENITAPDEFNIRTAAGMVLAGYKIEGDRRNIVGMASEIKHLRGVTTPLLVSQRPDGTNMLCQGYRRFNGVLLIQREEPGSPLAEKLKHLPVMVYTGLTAAQERQLVNDQTSQSFSAADVFRFFMEQYDGGFHWLNICSRTYPQIGQVTDSMDNVRKIDSITDEKEKEKALREWLTSFVYTGWVNGLKSGPIVRNLWLQMYLWKDGYKGVPRPRVVIDSNRMRKVWTAVQADTKDGNFNHTTGEGPKLLACLAEMEADDNKVYNEDGTKKRKPKTEKDFTLRPATQVKEIIQRETVGDKPNLVARILSISKKDGGDPEAVQLVKGFDLCRGVYLQHQPYLKPDLTAILNLIFGGVTGSEDTFTRFLMENYSDTDPTDEASKELVATTELDTAIQDVIDVPTVPTIRQEEADVGVEVPAEPVATAPEVPAEPFVEPAEGDAEGLFSLNEGETTGEVKTDAPVNPDGSKKKSGKRKHAHN